MLHLLKPLFLLGFFIILIPRSGWSQFSFSIGALGKYNSLKMSQGSSNVVYSGFGTGLDARLSSTPKPGNSKLGIELFFQFDQFRAKNSSAEHEFLKLSQSSFGLDISHRWIFLGAQVLSSYGVIETATRNFGISFDQAGLRGGLKFQLGSSLDLRIGGSSTSGTLLVSRNADIGSDRNVQAQSGFIEIGLRLSE